MDECGIEEDLVREYGRIQDKDNKAQRLYGDKTGTKHKKTGVISGYSRLPDKEKYQYIAPMVFSCNCDTEVFNTWITKRLLPTIKLIRQQHPNRSINLVMDNVSYHKSELTKKILIKNNINLVFQPAYSPDLSWRGSSLGDPDLHFSLNPIEPSWTQPRMTLDTSLTTKLIMKINYALR